MTADDPNNLLLGPMNLAPPSSGSQSNSDKSNSTKPCQQSWLAEHMGLPCINWQAIGVYSILVVLVVIGVIGLILGAK